MANKIIGKVALTPKGNYNASTKYSILDVVTSGVDLYAAITDVPVGTPTSNTSYWQKLISGCSPSTEQIVQKGSYNLIPYPYLLNSRTYNGITFNANTDGTIIANGTTTGASGFYFSNVSLERNKKYRILSTNNDDGKVFVYVNLYNGDTYVKTIARSGAVKEFTITDEVYDTVRIGISVLHPSTLSNYEFKPMLVEVAADGSYPTEYIRGSILSNSELTEELNSVINASVSCKCGNTVVAKKTKKGNLVTYVLSFTLTSDLAKLGELASGFDKTLLNGSWVGVLQGWSSGNYGIQFPIYVNNNSIYSAANIPSGTTINGTISYIAQS